MGEMLPHEPAHALLLDACRLLITTKYRIDDFLDMLWHCNGSDDAIMTVDGVEWLDAIGKDLTIDDHSWIVDRYPSFDSLAGSKSPVRYALHPRLFLGSLFPPFAFYSGHSTTNLKLCDVDSSLVVGGTYQRNWPTIDTDSQADLGPKRLHQILDEVNKNSANSFPGDDSAYIKVGKLPLYVAEEGKNRVRAFRAAGRTISAFACSTHFPDATSIKLHEVVGSSMIVTTNEITASTDVLILPSVTIPLLEAYGVQWGLRLNSRQVNRHGTPLQIAYQEALAILVTCRLTW